MSSLQIGIFCYVPMVTPRRWDPNVTGEFYVRLGTKIREARESARLTQADLSARAGLSRSSIANIEAGRQAVYLHQAVAIASALGRTVPDLVPGVAVGADATDAPLDARAIRELIEQSESFSVDKDR